MGCETGCETGCELITERNRDRLYKRIFQSNCLNSDLMTKRALLNPDIADRVFHVADESVRKKFGGRSKFRRCGILGIGYKESF
ncbi:hypothetical protein Pdw03_8799 [Penicillium digitatum]|uniref:Uncharacterized protein n=1 Tax=Penicillium digitatum TaxID=36651 RepID=A0A7T6XP86_PENDI|nr:hypothetical protein Pdw03_8799 [Penicillium digitatum]